MVALPKVAPMLKVLPSGVVQLASENSAAPVSAEGVTVVLPVVTSRLIASSRSTVIAWQNPASMVGVAAGVVMLRLATGAGLMVVTWVPCEIDGVSAASVGVPAFSAR